MSQFSFSALLKTVFQSNVKKVKQQANKPRLFFSIPVIAGLLLSVLNASAQQSAGFNNTFLVLSLNGGANTFYDLNAATANTDFNGANLGSFVAGSSNLVFKGAEHNVYKCGGADLTSTRVYYRIYLTSAGASGTFISNNIGFTSGFNNGCGGQDQVWSNTGYSTNLLSGLAPGNYSIQVYSDASTTLGTRFASNNGNNYTATFTVSSIVWANTGASTAWYTNTNWSPSTASNAWLTGNIAEFQNAGTATTAGINLGTASLSIGAIDVASSRTRALTIGNSSATTGTLTLNGASLGSNSNVILRNSSSSLLTLQDNETGTGKTMNITLANATTNVIDAAGSGGITISSAISGASRSITKIGSSGTLTLSGTNTYSGGTIISGGTVSAGAAANLGDAAGAITLGSGATSATLAATNDFTRNTVNITTSSTAGVIDVASTRTLTIGALNTVSGTDNTTKIGKSGAGTLTLSGAGSYVGQTQIGQGTVIVSNNAGLGTNNSTSARGIDLGLNVGDVSQANNVSVLATNGITVPQSIYVAPNTSSATRTIGTSGANASATFSNEIFLDGSATLAPVSGGTLTMSGNIINTGGLTTTTGTTLLSGTNTYSGTTTVNSGTLRLGSTSALGSTGAGAGTSITSGAVLDLNGINYSSAEALTLNGTGISSGGALINGSSTGATYAGLLTLGSNSSIIGGTGTIALSNAGTITGSGFGLTLGGAQGGSLASVIGTGTGTLTKQDAGTWTLSGVNTYSGTTSISGGTLALSGSGVTGTGNISIASGATFDVSAKTGNVAFGTSQSLSIPTTGANNTATVTVGSDDGVTLGSTGGITFSAYGGANGNSATNAPLTVTGATAGALALNSAPVTVTTTSALAVGTYILIAKGASATGVSGTPGALTVSGSGLAAGAVGTLSVSGGQLILTVVVAPTITTTVAPNTITHNSASSGGQTLSGTNITAKGVVWNTSTAPTVALTTKTDDGTGTDNFTSSITSLSAQTQYFVRAYVTNAAGTGYGDEQSFRTLSSPATAQASGFSATATSSSNIDLNWTGATFPGSGATASGYILLRAISPNTPSLGNSNGAAPTAGANTTIVSSSIANNATSFSNSGLASSTSYNYLLVPFTWDGTNATTYNYLTASAPTGNATTQAGATPPVLTTNAATSISASGATLNGEITSDGGGSVTARGFVYSSTDLTPTIGESGVTDQSAGTGTGSYNASVSLSENTTYYFQAYATNSSGTSYGGVLNFTTPKAEPAAQPTSLVFSSVTTSSFSTAFTAATGSPDGYIVIRSTSATLSANPADGTTYTAGNSLGGGTILSVGATVSGISSSSLSAGTTYYVFVFAYNNSGSIIDYLTTSPLSSSVVTVTSAPSAPSFGSVTTTGATVSWAAVTGAADYRLDVSTVSNFASFVSGYNDLTVSGTSQALTGLTPNTNYFARVRAVNASGTSASSSSGSAATLHNAPTVGSGSGATTSAITANWTAPTGGGAVTFTYTLELSTNAADFSSPVSTQVNIASGTLSFQFTLLTQGTVYYYRVRAVNATGASDWSAVSTGYSTLASTISLAALGTAVTENFNGMGTSGTATIPTGIRIGTDFTTGTSATTLTYGNTGTGVVTSSSSGGAINWADGVAGSATDRALGFLTTGSYTSPRSIICAFTNNTGSAITNLQLSWDYEKYRSGTRAIDWTFFHGSTSAAATAATAGDQSYAADANTSTVFSPSSDIAKSLTLTGLNIADGATYYLRWTYTGVGGSTNSQGLAIDDLSIKGCGTVSAPTAADQAFCSAVNPTIASLTATGSGIQWYAASSGGSALSTSAALTNNTIYYASQTVGGCESVTRTAVTVTINTNPSVPTGSATQTFCSSASPTVSSLTASGTSIQWYSASTGGTALSGSNALVNTTYHATQTVNGCESQTRLAVTAQVFDNGTWLGDVSGDWNTSGNWCGGVPTSSSNVVVVSGRPNSPVISSAASAASLTINSGASLSFSGTPTLTLSGNLTNNGTFTAGSSTVAFNAASTVSGTVAFNNVTLSASMNPGTASTINGLLLLNSSGSISTNSPSFGTSSTLEYGYGGGFGSRRNQALEWPSSNGPANLTVSNGSWIQLTGSRSLSGNVSISNGALQASGARTLTMNGTTQTITVSNSTGGAIFGTDNGFGNDLTLTIANGSTTTFTGNATTNGDDEKKFVAINVNTGGTLALSRGILCKYGSFTVNGTLQINSNGYVQSTAGVAPTYGASSTLVYNSGGTYGRGLEWSATSGAGYPNNVTLSNSTNLDVVNGDNSFKRAAGNLTVNTGSTFSVPNLTVGSSGLGVEFLGSITNDGTISLTGTTDERLKAVSLTNGSSNSTATVNLSSVVGGDLELTGNYTDNANFNANSRAVFFTGSGTQTIGGTASAPFNIDYIVLNKTSGIVQLSQDLLTGAPNGGNGITLNSASDIIDLNGRTLTLGTNNQTCAISGNGLFRGNSASGMIINGTGALGTLRFESGNRSLANLTINRTGTGSVTLGSDLSVGSTLTLTDGVLNVGSNNLSVGGSVARTSGTINAASGTVTFNGGSAQSVPTGLFTSGTLSNLTVPNNGGVSFSENLTVTGNLTVNGLFIPAADVVVGGAGTLTGTGTIRVTRATGTADLTNQYTLNRTLTNLTAEFAGASAQGIAAATLGGLKLNNSNGLTMGGNVTVSGGVDFTSGNLSIGANTLTIGGAVSRTSGNFVGGATSNLTLNGTAGNIFFQSGGSDNSLRSLTLGTSGSATLGNELNIVANDGSGNEGVLTVNSTTGGLNTGGFLTLKSAANGTARVAAGRTSGGYITGAVSVERFIPQNNTKAWRLLAANTQGQSINAAWQEGQAGVNANSTPGFGTMITGQAIDDADANSKGFDKKSPGYSILRWNPETNALVGIENTLNSNVSDYSGYFLFIRGDRGNGGSFGTGVPNSSTTLRSKGTLYTGNQTSVTIPSGQFALIGNPYPSRIDLRNVSVGSGIVNAFQVWDPKLSGTAGLGAYQALTWNGTNYTITPGGGTYGGSGSVQNFIESGSAFFMESSSNTNNTVTITESCKTSGSSVVNRPANPASTMPSLVTNLYAINSATSTELADGNRIDYDVSYSNDKDVLDVKKNYNFADNFSLYSNNTDLIVERRSLPTPTDTVFFGMSGLKRIGYQLDFIATGLVGTGLSAVLEDTYLNTATPVNLEGTTSYTFTVDANAGSSAARRFRIVFRPQAPLPVTVRSVRAWQQQSDIKVEWTVANQLNISRYMVEKSTDGRNFSAAGTVVATGNNRAEISYNWLDAQPVQGANYYRIRSVGVDGSYSVSAIVKVVIGKSAPAVTVWPNPVEGHQMNLNIYNMPAGNYQVRLVNSIGQSMSVNKISHAGGSAVQIIALPLHLNLGIYNLEFIGPDGKGFGQQIKIK